MLVVERLISRVSRPPKLSTKDGRVSFHPKSVNTDETHFVDKFLIYHTKVKSSQIFIHDASMIPPFPLLFFGGDISVQRDEGQETIAVDQWIVFQAPTHIAQLVKVMCVLAASTTRVPALPTNKTRVLVGSRGCSHLTNWLQTYTIGQQFGYVFIARLK